MSENNEKSFMDQINTKIENWTETLNDLKDQFDIESDRSMDEFENQKVKLTNWLHEASEKLNNYADLNEDKLTEFKSSLMDLKDSANQEKAKTLDTLTEQHKKLSYDLDGLKGKLTELYKASKDDVKEYSNDALDKLEDLHSKLDIYKLQAENIGKDGETMWEEKKKVAVEKIQELKAKLEDNKDFSEDKWDNFSNEISEAWHHIRKSLKS